MNLPADTHLAYIVWQEAWYSQPGSGVPYEKPYLMVMASAKGTGGGVAWEFPIEEDDLGGPVTRVLMFDDAYDAFVQMPEFFAALVEEKPKTLDAVRTILDRFGAVDETDRVSPYAVRP